MNLVGYSDSEGSDNEAMPIPNSAAKASSKLVNPSTHKVKVNLASLTADKDDIEKEAPPAKKARTGGGGLDINAFLPAPKKIAPVSKGLGRGVNLRTGAEPAFSREPPPQTYGGDTSHAKDTAETKRAELPKVTQPEVKLVGNAMRFRPLSVAKNAKKKKPIPAPASTTISKASSDSAPLEPIVSVPNTVKPKVSLFSIGKEQAPAIQPSSATFYNPIMLEQEEPEEAFETDDIQENEQSYPPPSMSSTNTVDTLTSNLNLSAADMRQLFGRKAGKGDIPDMSAINVVNFNTDAEYAANNDLIAKGETITHNPVRALAPGKHSLKQLVNAASNQREALEEHIAQGKRNQREAGARYGW